MRFFRIQATVRWVLVIIASLTSVALWSQQPAQDFTQSAPIFPNVLAPYKARHVSEANLTNSTRIGSLIQDGKLMLSLDDAIALALENNLDLVIARYNLPIADTDILRTKSGGSDRGVNTGLVQGTPGGGVGGIGNTGAAGGGSPPSYAGT